MPINSLTTWVVLLFCSGAMLLQSEKSLAQSTSPYNVITYRNGQLQGQLPYGKSFGIEGFTLQPGSDERATAVELRVYEEAQRRRRIRQDRSIWRRIFRPNRQTEVHFQVQPRQQYFWWYTSDKDSTKFDFYISQALQVDTYYKFELRFYRQLKAGDALTQQIVDSVKRKLYVDIIRQGNRSVRLETVEDALNEAVIAYTKDLDFGYLKPGGSNQLQFDTTEKRLKLSLSKFSAETSLQLGQIIQLEQVMDNLNRQLLAYRQDTLAEIRAASEVQDLLGRLQQAYQEAQFSADPNQGFQGIALDGLRTFLQEGEVAYNPFPELLAYANSPQGQQRLQPIDAQVLTALQINYFDVITERLSDKATLRARIQSLNDQINSSGDFDQFIADGFIKAGAATFINTPYAQGTAADGAASSGGAANQRVSGGALQSTGYNAINIGTTYGIALVGLNMPSLLDTENLSFTQTEPNLISYLGAKFYFNRVDRARFIQEPYPLFRDRFSLLVGVRATGQLNYRGRTFDNVIGFQPVGGICLDLNRNLSVDAGVILFNESSLSPFNNTQRLRAAPFIGLSLDANAFNFLRNTINGANIQANQSQNF